MQQDIISWFSTFLGCCSFNRIQDLFSRITRKLFNLSNRHSYHFSLQWMLFNLLAVLIYVRKEETMTLYPADVVLFEGILMFYSQEIRDFFHMKLFVDTDADTRLSRRGDAWRDKSVMFISTGRGDERNGSLN